MARDNAATRVHAALEKAVASANAGPTALHVWGGVFGIPDGPGKAGRVVRKLSILLDEIDAIRDYAGLRGIPDRNWRQQVQSADDSMVVQSLSSSWSGHRERLATDIGSTLTALAWLSDEMPDEIADAGGQQLSPSELNGSRAQLHQIHGRVATVNGLRTNATSQVSLETLDKIPAVLGVEAGDLIRRTGRRRY